MHIDWWTLALQTVNVVVLVWILARFFFRPIADLVAKRKEATARLLTDADAARKEAESLRDDAAKLRANVNAERDGLIGEAHKAAEAEKASLLAQLSGDLEQRRKDAAAAIDRERGAMERAALDHASELSVDIARRLLERIPAAAGFAAFLEGLGSEIGKLPAGLRASLETTDREHPLEVASATPLDDDQMAQLRDALRTALGKDLPLRVSCDPRLISGLEIRGKNVIVRNNWQADLARIRKELKP